MLKTRGSADGRLRCLRKGSGLQAGSLCLGYRPSMSLLAPVYCLMKHQERAARASLSGKQLKVTPANGSKLQIQ